MMFFGLYSKLIVGIAIALALSAGFWKAYHSGYNARDAIAQVEEAQRTAQALEASEAARKVEQELSAKVRKVSDDYRTARKNLDHLAAASSNGLRNLEAILTAPATASSGAVASAGNHGTGGLERELLALCAADFARMGQEAQRLQGKTVGLQDYIKAIKP